MDRTEERFQIADNVNWIIGNHTTKFGADFNFVDIDAVFELNFPGLFNFGTFGLQPPHHGAAGRRAPALEPVQSYGLGIPSVFIKASATRTARSRTARWPSSARTPGRCARNLTLNYGLRYDIELTDTIAPVRVHGPA